MKSGTTPLESLQGIPVQCLQVTVVDGPDVQETRLVEGDRVTIGTADGNDLVLSDPTVSRYHLELRRTPRGVHVSDLQSTNGTFVGNVLIERCLVRAGSTIRLGHTKLVVEDQGQTTREVYDGDRLGGIVGRSPAMRHLMARVAKVATTPVSVLLVGESGTGKEVVARTIHELSQRAEQPYELVDCASLASQLIASELFGHERGAFTGADRQHVGAFERAHRGSLFLDEIGELPAELQPNLLGALERRRIRRVGGKTDKAIDVRVISATNRDLRSEVNSNAFRLDLFYRLAVVSIEVPPLRDRPEDVPLLAEHFARELGTHVSFEDLFPEDVRQAMSGHRWPGNVRELRNLVDATVAMGEAPPLSQNSAQPFGPGIHVGEYLDLPYKQARKRIVEQFEARYLPHLLAQTEGNVSEAARRARMDRSYLFSLLRKHQLR